MLFSLPGSAEPLRAEWGDEVRQTCNWAGASCAVVAASPLIGKVAQLSYERTLGTLTGGLLGYLVRLNGPTDKGGSTPAVVALVLHKLKLTALHQALGGVPMALQVSLWKTNA